MFTSIRSRSRSLTVLGVPALAIILMLSFGCSSHPENSPVVRKKFKEMADLQDQVGNLHVQMKQMSAEMAAVRKDVGDVVALNGGGEAVTKIEQIDTRLLTLEKQLTEIHDTMTATAKSRQVASASDSSETSTREVASSSSKSSSKPTVESSSSMSSSTKASRSSAPAVPVRKVSSTSTTPKPRGKYYTTKSGDTPDSIASAHNIKVETLLQANRLPKGATIFPGQRVYVPATN